MSRKIIGIAALAVLLAGTGFTFNGWRNQLSHGNRQLAKGQAGEAITSYQQGLVDAPEEPSIHYNLGNALYRNDDFGKAAEHFTKAKQLTEDQELQEQAEYNLGNARYREGAALVEKNPAQAINKYEQALQEYKNALRNNPADQDAKFNYEFVKKKLDELKEKQENHDQQKNEQDGQDGQQDKQGQNDQQKQGDDEENNDGQENQPGDQGQQDKQDGQGQQNDQDQQESGQDQQNENQLNNQENQAGENGQDGEENSAAAGETGDDTAADGEQGLTKAQALQLLQQFEDPKGYWIPVQPEENGRTQKDW